jgi:hypothetical protein
MQRVNRRKARFHLDRSGAIADALFGLLVARKATCGSPRERLSMIVVCGGLQGQVTRFFCDRLKE